MVAMIEECMEDCKNDLDLKSFDDKCRTWLKRMITNADEAWTPRSLSSDQLKESISFVCEMNKCISDQVIRAEDEIVKFMAGEAECFKLWNQYSNITSEMLDFCCNLDKFVLSARDSHSYISHVIGQLEIDRKRNHVLNLSSSTSFRGIVDVLEKLKTSGDNSVASLFQSIASLQKKYDDMSKALQSYHDKLDKKQIQKRFGTWKKITNWMFYGSMFCAGALGLLALTFVLVNPPLLVTAGLGVSTVLAIGGSLKALVPILGLGRHMIVSLLQKAETETLKQQEVLSSMQNRTIIAYTELGGVKEMLTKLDTLIDSILTDGKYGMDQKEEPSIDYSMNKIKDKLRIFLNKIQELDEEQERCTSEIRKARADFLERVKKAK